MARLLSVAVLALLLAGVHLSNPHCCGVSFAVASALIFRWACLLRKQDSNLNKTRRSCYRQRMQLDNVFCFTLKQLLRARLLRMGDPSMMGS
jgi:hypothetical protein